MVFAMAFACVAFVSDDASADDVAKIYEVASKPAEGQYSDIAAAITEAGSETNISIKLLDDVTGSGFKTTSGKNVTIDLNGHKYTINKAVGSSNTETNGMQLLKDSTVSITNGTITATDVALILIQNYSNLTLDNVVLDGTGMTATDAKYILSVNNGHVIVKGNTSFIGKELYAFDICSGWSSSYKGPVVEFDETFTGSVNKFEVAKYGMDADAEVGELVINGGTISGGEFNTYIKDGNGNWIEGGNGIPSLHVTLNGGSISVKEGEQFNGEIVSGNNTAKIGHALAGKGGVTISLGSIVISGTINCTDNVEITATGEVKLDGVVIDGDGTTNGLTIKKVSEDDKIVIQDLTVQKGAKLTVEGDANVTGTLKIVGEIDVSDGKTLTIDEKAKLVVSGTITDRSSITNNGTIQITDPKAVIPNEIAGSGTVDTSAVAVDGTISGEFNTDTKFTQNQIITMTADTYLVEDTILTIEGKLVIPEGVILYIQDEARLVVSTATGYLENNGTIVVESKVDAKEGTSAIGAGALLILNGTVENNGTIDLAYSEDDVENPNVDVSMNNTGTLINNGEIVVGEDSFFYMWNDVQNLGTITMNGTIMADHASKIVNSGEVVLNGIIKKNKLTIDLKTEDATIQFVSVEKTEGSGDAVEITTTVEKKNTVVSGTPAVTVGVTEKFQVSGLIVSATLVKDVDANTYTRNLVMSGDIIFSTDVESATAAPVTIGTTGNTLVEGELNLAAGVELAVGGPMLVSGDITSVYNTILNGPTKYGKITATETITVTGSIVAGVAIENNNVNAAYYNVAATVSTPAVYNYTTLDKAISAGATKIEMLGTNTVSSDVSVPSGTTVTIKGATTIGADATVTFTSGAIMKGEGTNPVDVDGTLVFDDKKTGDKNASNITSDVIKEGENDRTYTNITAALAGAVSGDTVKLKDNADITRNTVIPEGVTLDTAEKDLTVLNDVTLTVDGTLFLNDGTLTLTPEKTTETGATLAAGKLVLNGTVKSTNQISDALAIAGAYYSISEKADTYYYVQPVATAAPIIATVDDLAMTIKSFDTDIDIGSVSFAGTADEAAVVVIDGKLKAGTITIDNAEIDFGAKAFAGSVTNSTGTVTLDGTATAGFKVSSQSIDDVKTMIVAGEFNAAEKKTVTVSGDVTFKGFNANTVKIDGNVIVLKDATSTITDLTVNGTVTVNNGATLSTTTLSVYGTVDAKAATTSAAAGNVKADIVYVGLGSKDVGADAAISGSFTITDKMYVVDGASVPETLVDGKKSLQVFVEDKIWMTVYNMKNGENTVVIKKIPVENVKLTGWTIGTKSYGEGAELPIADGKAYAQIKYDVYEVTVQIAEGIDDVYMDGVLMNRSGSEFTANVDAGQHTISYTLSNGYGGEATMLVNGEKVTGYAFTASGDFNKVSYKIVLQDVEKTGYTPDAPDNNGGSDGMSITDYLLIVLVVLIVIMAVLVAIRMMRS